MLRKLMLHITQKFFYVQKMLKLSVFFISVNYFVLDN